MNQRFVERSGVQESRRSAVLLEGTESTRREERHPTVSAMKDAYFLVTDHSHAKVLASAEASVPFSSNMIAGLKSSSDAGFAIAAPSTVSCVERHHD